MRLKNPCRNHEHLGISVSPLDIIKKGCYTSNTKIYVYMNILRALLDSICLKAIMIMNESNHFVVRKSYLDVVSSMVIDTWLWISHVIHHFNFKKERNRSWMDYTSWKYEKMRKKPTHLFAMNDIHTINRFENLDENEIHHDNP